MTKSGINTQNIEITDHTGQLQRTGNRVQTALEGIRTDITTETAQAHSGSVTNRFDKDALQKELDIQRTTTEAFGKNAAQAVALASEKFGKVKEYQVIEHQKVLAEQALDQETDPGKRAELTRTIDLAEDYLKTHKAEYETWKEGGVGRVALHAVAGGLLTGNLSGAVASGTTSAAAPHLEELSKELGNVGKAVIDIGAGMAIGAVTGAITGGGVSAVSASGNTDWHNRQLHPNEVARIKGLAGDDKEKELRLTIAACALVHCSAQIPSDSAQYSDAYTNAKMLEDLGNSAEFEAERTLLSKQYELMTDSWGAGVKKPLFDYNFAYAGLDYAAAKDSKYALTTRAGGALQAVGGAVTIVGSYSGAAATCVASSGLGCGLAAGAGSVGATIGADHLDTGVKTLIDGKAYPTTGAKLLSDVTGISLDNAELIYGVVPAERVISGINSSSKLPVIGKTTNYPKIEFNPEAHNAAVYEALKMDLKTQQAANTMVESLQQTGKLPDNFITKAEAQSLGWKSGKVVPDGKSIGQEPYSNKEGLLPNAPNRQWYEADINYQGTKSRGEERLLYSNDGLLYFTRDHYETIESMGRWK